MEFDDKFFQFLSDDGESTSDLRLDFDELDLGQGEGSVLLTPPISTSNSPESHDPLISVSVVFTPEARLDRLRSLPDTVILSSDNVWFYVHAYVLLGLSSNGFGGILYTPGLKMNNVPPMLRLSHDSTLLNLVLHIVYDISSAAFFPTFDFLVDAVELLPSFGLEPKALVNSSTSIFPVLSAHAPQNPLGLYALAAHFDIHELAVLASPHLLSHPLATLSDEITERMGPIYLKRLFFLHFGRVEALKNILLGLPPHHHVPSNSCSFHEQDKLTRAWALAAASMVWEVRPDLPATAIESAFGSLKSMLTCEICKQTLRNRVAELVVQWTLVRHTI